LNAISRSRQGKIDPHRSVLNERINQDCKMAKPERAGALADVTGVQARPIAIGPGAVQAGLHIQKTTPPSANCFAIACRAVLQAT
jgi:hypothetical protein